MDAGFHNEGCLLQDESAPLVRVLVHDGRIDYSALGDEFELDPTSIKLNESVS